MTFSVPNFDTTILATKIPISDLLKNYKSFQGQYIETAGYFYQAFEEFAIYRDKHPSSAKLNGFWLDTDEELTIDRASFEKMNGKQITIRGRIDTTNKGHLSSYLATIDRIHFWQW